MDKNPTTDRRCLPPPPSERVGGPSRTGSEGGPRAV